MNTAIVVAFPTSMLECGPTECIAEVLEIRSHFVLWQDIKQAGRENFIFGFYDRKERTIVIMHAKIL
jgi:hypothetical protein